MADASEPGIAPRPGDLLPADPGKHKVRAGKAQRSPEVARSCYIRRHGDGFRHSVEPESQIPGLSRRFDSHADALGFAVLVRAKHGWPLIDETNGGRDAGHIDPSRRVDRPAVFVDEVGGLTVVTISPRPFGCRQPVLEFFNAAKALEHAVRSSVAYSRGRAPLRIVDRRAAPNG